MNRVLIPDHGRDADALLAEMDSFRGGDADYRSGRTWSMVYHLDDAHHALLERASSAFLVENALNPMAFRSLKRMEAEVVQMTTGMLHGPDSAVGAMTSGGTESLLLAVKTARDAARKKRPWLRRPEMVVPRTIHPAFDKAAHYFGVRPRYVDVGADFRADVPAMAKAVNRRTVLIAGSAPQYVNGVVDPIEDLGQIALKKGIPLHVDACFGGFILPWLEKLGHPVPRWDFRVPGVTSISADVHKYGYCPKGASVLLYRSMDLMRHQFFVSTDWPGGIYASPSIAGSRPGGPIAGAWASLQKLGEDGFMAAARTALDAALRLRAGIEAIDGLRVLGAPHSTIVTWAADADDVDVYAVADQLVERGWSVDRQQSPPSIHCTVGPANAPVVDDYLADVRASVAHVRQHPELASQGEAAMYGLMAGIPVRGLVKDSVRQVMANMYGPGVVEPELDQGDGPVARFMESHGDKVLAVSKRIEGIRQAWAAR